MRKSSKDAYLTLIGRFPLLAIRNEAQLKAAIKMVDTLTGKPELLEGEVQYLDALSELIYSYESAHHSLGPASDAALLSYLMDAKGVNQTQVSTSTGISKSAISEILSGKKTSPATSSANSPPTFPSPSVSSPPILLRTIEVEKGQ